MMFYIHVTVMAEPGGGHEPEDRQIWKQTEVLPSVSDL